MMSKKSFFTLSVAVLFSLFLSITLSSFSAADETDNHAVEHADDHGDAHGHGHEGHDHGDGHDDHGHGAHADGHGDGHHGDGHHGNACGHDLSHKEGYEYDENGEIANYNPTPTIFHHISDANEWHLWPGTTIPLPVMPYSKKSGLMTTMSSAFHHGEYAIDGYIMDHGKLLKIEGEGFPNEKINLENHGHFAHKTIIETSTKEVKNKKTGEMETVTVESSREVTLVCYKGDEYYASRSGFTDFSITKNVATLLIVSLIMLALFISVAGAYKKRVGMAPKGLQSFMEPLITFVRDDIAVPNLGKNADKFMPFLMTVFFFIWIANMIGQIPFITNPNLTGNIAVTLALSLFTLIFTIVFASKHFWHHTLTAPGTPFLVKIILVPIEVLGIFIKPAALTIRLFANITAGHIIILSLTSLVFVFGKAGASLGGSAMGASIAVPFVIFIGIIELLVAFLQAFIFTMLSALYIGMAMDEGHDAHH